MPDSAAPGVDSSAVYQRIGEFIVSFQWTEQRVRELGWLMLDPERAEWPPRRLRNLTNEKLINRVRRCYCRLVDSFIRMESDERETWKRSFGELCDELHRIRDQRNALVHAAYVTLRAGGEDAGLLQANVRLQTNPDTGEVRVDSRILESDHFDDLMGTLAQAVLQLNRHYMQAIHWVPFDRFQ